MNQNITDADREEATKNAYEILKLWLKPVTDADGDTFSRFSLLGSAFSGTDIARDLGALQIACAALVILEEEKELFPDR